MKKTDLFFPLLSVLFGGVYWYEALDYPPQSAFFPKAVIIVLVLFSVVYVVKEFVKARQCKNPFLQPSGTTLKEGLGSMKFRRAFTLCAAIFLYWILAKPLGFILVNLIIIVGLMKFLGANWLRTIVLALLITLLMHFFFREYLHVPFPRGPGEWFYYWLKHNFIS